MRRSIGDVTAVCRRLAFRGEGAFAAHVAGSYDSSADYWKLTEDGDIVFDRKRDLYDEEGNLLREFEGEGGYTAALAEHLGISETEANGFLSGQDSFRLRRAKHLEVFSRFSFIGHSYDTRWKWAKYR